MIMYELQIKPVAKKSLEKLPKPDRIRISEKLDELSIDPDNPILDVRPIIGEIDCYRLRVGKWRIIFARKEEVRIISIERIKSRGDVYK